MKQIILGLSLLLALAACSSEPATSDTNAEESAPAITTPNAPAGTAPDGYPKEYADFELPEYPNVTEIEKATSTPLGDDGDIQMIIKLKTNDDVKKVGNFFSEKLLAMGYKDNVSNQLDELKQQGAPVDASNFFSGSYQKGGRLFNVTAMYSEEKDRTTINISVVGM
ncbi:MAG: lipoprotein [Bacteroidota bacterium]